MKKVNLKYGKEVLSVNINEEHIINTLIPKDCEIIADVKNEVEDILNNPIGTKPLNEIVSKGEKIAIIVSDITRAWLKSDKYIIHILNYLTNLGIEDEDIFIVIALGGHRKSTKEEMITIVGQEVYNRVKVYDHECEDLNELVYLGKSSRNTPIYINKKVHEADRVIITGGIVFHLFAGFGGGAKSILPGVSGMKTIQANHKLCFNNDGGGSNVKVASNKIKDNPIREDMNEVCNIVNPDFLFNVVMNTDGEFIKFVGGHFEKAWIEGCESIRNLYGISIEERADIIIASAGGYPKDINLYQTVKTIDNALYGGNEGSVLILLSECIDGLGADEFADWFKYPTLEDVEKGLKENFTVPGYIAYKTYYTTHHRKVILISSIDDDTVKKLNMIPSHNIDEALSLAYEMSKCENPKITLMPYGGNTLPISL